MRHYFAILTHKSGKASSKYYANLRPKIVDKVKPKCVERLQSIVGCVWAFRTEGRPAWFSRVSLLVRHFNTNVSRPVMYFNFQSAKKINKPFSFSFWDFYKPKSADYEKMRWTLKFPYLQSGWFFLSVLSVTNINSFLIFNKHASFENWNTSFTPNVPNEFD